MAQQETTAHPFAPPLAGQGNRRAADQRDMLGSVGKPGKSPGCPDSHTGAAKSPHFVEILRRGRVFIAAPPGMLTGYGNYCLPPESAALSFDTPQRRGAVPPTEVV